MKILVCNVCGPGVREVQLNAVNLNLIAYLSIDPEIIFI